MTSVESLPVEIQEDFLTCKLCTLPFNLPKSLPCLHAFCKPCIGLHVERNAIKAPDGTSCIFCPLCKQICDIPESGVDGLQDNDLLRNLLDMIGSQTFRPCDSCRESGKFVSATYCCVQCEDFLCDDCTQIHTRSSITKHHVVISTASIKEVCKGLRNKFLSGISVKLSLKFGKCGESLFDPVCICTNKASEIIISQDNETISMFSPEGICKKTLAQKPFYESDSESEYLPNRCVTVTSEGYYAVAMRKQVAAKQVQVAVIQSLAGREIKVCTVKTSKGQQCHPHGIATTGDNKIVVSDIGRNCIYVFNSDCRLIKQFGRRGSRSCQFKSPYFVAATRHDILVSDYGNHCIKVFDFKGKFKFKFGQTGSVRGQLLHPMGLCLDRLGNIFVCDRDNHRVLMFDAYGQLLTVILQDTYNQGNDIRPYDVATTANEKVAILLKGVEGVDLAEVQIYQYGVTRRQTPGLGHIDLDMKSNQSQLGVVDLINAMPQSRANQLPPLEKEKTTDASQQGCSGNGFVALNTENNSGSNSQQLTSNSDHESQVCVIL